jgi:hypothetical protein
VQFFPAGVLFIFLSLVRCRRAPLSFFCSSDSRHRSIRKTATSSLAPRGVKQPAGQPADGLAISDRLHYVRHVAAYHSTRNNCFPR